MSERDPDESGDALAIYSKASNDTSRLKDVRFPTSAGDGREKVDDSGDEATRTASPVQFTADGERHTP